MKVILAHSMQQLSAPFGPSSTINEIPIYVRRVATTVSPILNDVDGPIETLLKRLQISKEDSNTDNKNFWDIMVKIGITDIPVPDSNIHRGIVDVWDVRVDGGILETMRDFFGGHLKLKIDILTLTTNSFHLQSDGLNINTNEIALEGSKIYSRRPYFQESNIGIFQGHGACSYWSHAQHTFTGTIVITAIVPDNICVPEDITITDKMSITRKILEQEIGCDLVVITANGEEIKCHKIFLSAHSSVFEAMFRGDTKESHTNTVEIPDMTEASFRTFLAYLYGWDIQSSIKSSVTCFDLFCASHKYNVGKLEESTRNILLAKDNDWKDVDVAMKLYLYTSNIEECKDLKVKAIRMLKSKSSVLQTSPSNQELFQKNPQAAMDFCQFALSV